MQALTNKNNNGTASSTPKTAPSSPFFHPSTPHVVIVQQTPRGTRRSITVKEEVKEHKSGLIGCTANLINAIVGSGIVGIPYAIKKAGFVAGIFLVLLCAVITEKSLRLLIATAKHVHVPTYETALEAAFGVWGFRFIVVNMFIMSYGAMLSYLMIVRDSFSVMLGIDEHDLPQKRAVLFVVSLCVMVPLSCQRDMADLAVTSRFSVIIDMMLVGLVAFNSPVLDNLQENSWHIKDDIIRGDTIFVGLGVLSFAYVCQHSAFLVAGSLERPTIRRWSTATGIALFLCAILALTCGIFGYLGYLDETNGNILTNLDPSSRSANVARGMLGTTMLFVYPLESHVARHSSIVMLFSGRRAHEGDDSSILNRRDRRIGLTVALYALAVVPAAFCEDMGYVLALTGAIGGSSLSYIGPGLVYLGVHGGRFLELLESSWFSTMMPKSMMSSNAKGSRKVVGDTLSIPTLAVETTPLVATQQDAADLAQPQSTADNEEDQEWFLVRCLKLILWYLSLCPLWCALARSGKGGLTRHIHEAALKSPHPIRIGDVEYSRALVSQLGRVHADPEKAAVVWPRRMASDSSLRELQHGESPLPFLAAHVQTEGADAVRAISPPPLPNGRVMRDGNPLISPGENVNQRIGKNILQRQQEEKQRKKQEELEADPQEAPPSWWDFFVAIFFILFGLLALFAGLASLFMEK